MTPSKGESVAAEMKHLHSRSPVVMEVTSTLNDRASRLCAFNKNIAAASPSP